MAKKIADATGDALLDMGKAYKAGDFKVVVDQGDSIGFVFPTYRWSTPPLVDEFVKRASFVTPDGAAFHPSLSPECLPARKGDRGQKALSESDYACVAPAAHSLKQAQTVADVLVFKGGVVEQGPTDFVMAHPVTTEPERFLETFGLWAVVAKRLALTGWSGMACARL